jgi:hypothetical protein
VERDDEQLEPTTRPRGRHAAPPSPIGASLTGLSSRAAAVLAKATAAFAALVAAVAAALAPRIERFRAGPVMPWISRNRIAVFIGGASLVSALALGGAVALIQQAAPTSVDEAGQWGTEGEAVPQEAPVPTTSPVTGLRTPKPTPTPTPTPTAVPADPLVPTETASPTSPDPTPTPTEEARRDTAPGATNRPDKPKG